METSLCVDWTLLAWELTKEAEVCSSSHWVWSCSLMRVSAKHYYIWGITKGGQEKSPLHLGSRTPRILVKSITVEWREQKPDDREAVWPSLSFLGFPYLSPNSLFLPLYFRTFRSVRTFWANYDLNIPCFSCCSLVSDSLSSSSS